MTQTETTRGPQPALIIWHVPERDGAPWLRLGAVWSNKEGSGYNGDLEAAPIGSGRIVMLPPKAKTENGE